ncbi:hypothetical protein CBL_08426 [Carabus blaptoides fortunei]
MNNGLIENKLLFNSKYCFEVTSETELTFRDFWKNHFNILHCLRIIDKAWDEVPLRTLKSSGRNLWPVCVILKDLEDTTTEAVVVNEIVSLAKSMGLDVDSDDVEELFEDHRNELTTEQLQELQGEQQEVLEDVSSEEEENISTKEIKELCHHLENIEYIVQKWHPNTAVANRSVNLFNDNDQHEKAGLSSINEVVQNPDDPSSDPVSPSSSSSFQSKSATPRPTGVYRQRKLATIFGNETISNKSKKQIDKNLVLLFILDIQPFSIVEDTGFKKFVSALNPAHQLPSIHTLSKTTIPALLRIKDIVSQGMKFCITTDCWISRNTGHYCVINNKCFLPVTYRNAKLTDEELAEILQQSDYWAIDEQDFQPGDYWSESDLSAEDDEAPEMSTVRQTNDHDDDDGSQLNDHASEVNDQENDDDLSHDNNSFVPPVASTRGKSTRRVVQANKVDHQKLHKQRGRKRLKNVLHLKNGKTEDDFGIEPNFPDFEPIIENAQDRQAYNPIDYYHEYYGKEMFVKLAQNSNIHYLQTTNNGFDTGETILSGVLSGRDVPEDDSDEPEDRAEGGQKSGKACSRSVATSRGRKT